MITKNYTRIYDKEQKSPTWPCNPESDDVVFMVCEDGQSVVKKSLKGLEKFAIPLFTIKKQIIYKDAKPNAFENISKLAEDAEKDIDSLARKLQYISELTNKPIAYITIDYNFNNIDYGKIIYFEKTLGLFILS